jgi:hypothetical protein
LGGDNTSALEDANSIPVGLGEVVQMILNERIDPKPAALPLYALQTASANLKHISFQPEPREVVIDETSVERRPIGATAWSKAAGREYDEVLPPDVEYKNEQEIKSAAVRLVYRKFGLNWQENTRKRRSGRSG